MSGFKISRDVSKIISFINRNCSNCERGYLLNNVPMCKKSNKDRKSIMSTAHEKVFLTEYCTENAVNMMPCLTCYAFEHIEEFNPFLNR